MRVRYLRLTRVGLSHCPGCESGLSGSPRRPHTDNSHNPDTSLAAKRGAPFAFSASEPACYRADFSLLKRAEFLWPTFGANCAVASEFVLLVARMIKPCHNAYGVMDCCCEV